MCIPADQCQQQAGVLLVHALHDRAKRVYEHYGFQVSPAHPVVLRPPTMST
jgi:hypothetical protein